MHVAVIFRLAELLVYKKNPPEESDGFNKIDECLVFLMCRNITRARRLLVD